MKIPPIREWEPVHYAMATGVVGVNMVVLPVIIACYQAGFWHGFVATGVALIVGAITTLIAVFD